MSLPVSIERTRNRSSRATLRDGTIHIRLAGRLSAAAEQEHIEILTQRMARACAKESVKHRIDPFRALFSEKQTTITVTCCTGQSVHIILTDGKKTSAKRTGTTWTVSRSEHISDASFERFLWKLLGISMEVDIAALVRAINRRTLRVPIRSISLKFMRSRWGSCSHVGNVSLSSTLLFTTPEILEYVIIHELAHVRHMNHSRAFWTLVEEHCPGFRERRKELRQFRVPGKRSW